MLNPYKWTLKDLSYFVITDNGIPYRFYFEDETVQFRDTCHGFPVFSFNIEVEGNINISEIPEDPRLADTTQELLTEFFSDDGNTLIVVYDTLDGRGEARRRKFNGWYFRFNIPDIIKNDYVTKVEDMEIPNSLFIHRNHPFRDLIITQYEKIVANGGYLP